MGGQGHGRGEILVPAGRSYGRAEPDRARAKQGKQKDREGIPQQVPTYRVGKSGKMVNS